MMDSAEQIPVNWHEEYPDGVEWVTHQIRRALINPDRPHGENFRIAEAMLSGFTQTWTTLLARDD